MHHQKKDLEWELEWEGYTVQYRGLLVSLKKQFQIPHPKHQRLCSVAA